MSSLASRILAMSPKSRATMINQTNIGEKNIICNMPVPILNLLMSGFFGGGLTCGITQLVGDSRTYKTNMCLTIIAAYMRINPKAVLVFLDSEFSAKPMMPKYGIDPERVVYIPFESLDEMKIVLSQMIGGVTREEDVIFFIDSISQVSSLKEVTDATKGDVKVDMTRAKEMNSVFRIITPMLNIRNKPLFCINSFYDDTTNEYADPIIKGGKQSFLSSDAVWFVTRAQDKDDTTKEIKGWFFNYKALKSRFVKEKSVFKLHVTYDGGIDWTSGLLDLGRESGLIKGAGWYELVDRLKTPTTSKKYQAKQLMDPANREFYDILLADPEFNKFCEEKYMLLPEERAAMEAVEAEAEAE